MEFTDEMEVIQDTNVKATIETLSSSTVRSCIKVKMPDGTFCTIIPVTNTSSVLGENGEILTDSLKNMLSQISDNTELLNEIDVDLKSHLEILDSGEEANNDIFTHIYDEMDVIAKSIKDLTSNINNLVSCISNMENDIRNITKEITQIKSDIELHKDTIL